MGHSRSLSLLYIIGRVLKVLWVVNEMNISYGTSTKAAVNRTTKCTECFKSSKKLSLTWRKLSPLLLLHHFPAIITEIMAEHARRKYKVVATTSLAKVHKLTRWTTFFDSRNFVGLNFRILSPMVQLMKSMCVICRTNSRSVAMLIVAYSTLRYINEC